MRKKLAENLLNKGINLKSGLLEEYYTISGLEN
jgi:hypothetical protein